MVFPIITAMIWGSSFVAQSTSTEHVGAYTFNAARSFVGFLACWWWYKSLKCCARSPGGADRCGKKAGRRDLILGGICCGIALALACNLQQLGMVARCQRRQDQLYHYALCGAGAHLRPVSQEKVSPTVWISVLLAVAGLYCLCIKENFTIAPSDLLVMLCLRLYAAHPGHRLLHPKGGRRENEAASSS